MILCRWPEANQVLKVTKSHRSAIKGKVSRICKKLSMHADIECLDNYAF
jgi:hypothetical protein